MAHTVSSESEIHRRKPEREGDFGPIYALVEAGVRRFVLPHVTEEQVRKYIYDTDLLSIKSDFFVSPSDRPKKLGNEGRLHGVNTLPDAAPQYLNDHTAITGGPSGPTGLQFCARPDLENAFTGALVDALEEEKYTPHTEDGRPIEGLVHKYGERVLATFTFRCAAYCRFCTRGREVGGAFLHHRKEVVTQALDWVESKARAGEINEIILSGGDPLMMEPEMLDMVTKRIGSMQREGLIHIVRVGTRLPIHNPIAVGERHYEALRNLLEPNVMLHVNSPWELTQESVDVVREMKKAGAVFRSQTVLLAGVNDDPQIMRQLARKLVRYQIIPYYIFVNDWQSWTWHYDVPFERIYDISRGARADLTGLTGTARTVFDVAEGSGKIPFPTEYLDFWATEAEREAFLRTREPWFFDYRGDRHVFTTGVRSAPREAPDKLAPR